MVLEDSSDIFNMRPLTGTPGSLCHLSGEEVAVEGGREGQNLLQISDRVAHVLQALQWARRKSARSFKDNNDGNGGPATEVEWKWCRAAVLTTRSSVTLISTDASAGLSKGIQCEGHSRTLRARSKEEMADCPHCTRCPVPGHVFCLPGPPTRPPRQLSPIRGSNISSIAKGGQMTKFAPVLSGHTGSDRLGQHQRLGLLRKAIPVLDQHRSRTSDRSSIPLGPK